MIVLVDGEIDSVYEYGIDSGGKEIGIASDRFEDGTWIVVSSVISRDGAQGREKGVSGEV